MKKLMLMAGLLVALLTSAAHQAGASIVSVGTPSGSTSTVVNARMRWGATGEETALWDSAKRAQINWSGTPAWTVGHDYMFQVNYTAATGELKIAVDFSKNNNLDANETASYSAWLPSLAGKGFKYMRIFTNAASSSGSVKISNWNINGSSFTDFTTGPNAISDQWFGSSTAGAVVGNWTISGKINFLTSGTSQERPVVNFNFVQSSALVPEPSTLGIWAMGALCFGLYRPRRQNGR